MRTEEARSIGPLLPWVCTVRCLDGRSYGITLYATCPEEIEAAWPWVTVDGQLMETIH